MITKLGFDSDAPRRLEQKWVLVGGHTLKEQLRRVFGHDVVEHREEFLLRVAITRVVLERTALSGVSGRWL